MSYKNNPSPHPKKSTEKTTLEFSISTMNHFYMRVSPQEEAKNSDNDSTITPEYFP